MGRILKRDLISVKYDLKYDINYDTKFLEYRCYFLALMLFTVSPTNGHTLLNSSPDVMFPYLALMEN